LKYDGNIMVTLRLLYKLLNIKYYSKYYSSSYIIYNNHPITTTTTTILTAIDFLFTLCFFVYLKIAYQVSDLAVRLNDLVLKLT